MDRTIRSAISNLAGFYQATAQLNIDYPNVVKWPTNFVPVPIHADIPLTEDYEIN